MTLKFDEICIDAHDIHSARRAGGPRCSGGAQEPTDDGDVVLRAPPGAGPTGCSSRCPTTRWSRTASTSTSGPTISRPRSTAWSRLAPGTSTSGKGDESWVVLADPEGNEFCILAADD